MRYITIKRLAKVIRYVAVVIVFVLSGFTLFQWQYWALLLTLIVLMASQSVVSSLEEWEKN